MGKPNFKQLSLEAGVNQSTIRDRWKAGKRGYELVRPAIKSKDRARLLNRGDRGETLIQISRRYGINHKTVSDRWHKGERGDKLRRPVNKSRKYLGFTAKQLGDLIVKRSNMVEISVSRVCNFLKYQLAKGATEEEAVNNLLEYYGVKLIKTKQKKDEK